jgi:hypothetical protein
VESVLTELRVPVHVVAHYASTCTYTPHYPAVEQRASPPFPK